MAKTKQSKKQHHFSVVAAGYKPDGTRFSIAEVRVRASKDELRNSIKARFPEGTKFSYLDIKRFRVLTSTGSPYRELASAKTKIKQRVGRIKGRVKSRKTKGN